MTNAFSLFRSLIVYGICLPLAIFVGYLLATPTDFSSYIGLGLLLMMMTVPLLLRWHYPWLIASWNMTAGLYFLPGKPSLTLMMVYLSFFFSVLAYIMNRSSKFISAPMVTRPLLFIAAVVIITAKLTNSLGLSMLGSEAVGGKRYILLLAGVVGFYAITAQKIPEHKANLYVKLFFLGGLTAAIGNLATLINPSFYFIFLIFPPDTNITSASSVIDTSSAITRLSGISTASVAIISLLLARYGIQGILDLKKFWRIALFIFVVTADLLGGFRSRLIDLLLLLGVMFYLEGLMRSRLLPVVLLTMVLVGAVIVPFSDKLPLSIQRSLTFLPLNLDEEAVQSAKGSTDWRLEMWSAVLPTVPQYLILGKGLGIDAHDLAMVSSGMTKGTETGAGSALAGDYHNGPLSLIISFGIFGVIGFIWFLIAGVKVLYRNYKFGNPEYERVNRFLFAFFLVRTIIFFLIFGSFYSDLVVFVGPVALSIALNGGVCSPEYAPVEQPVVNKFRLVNAAR